MNERIAVVGLGYVGLPVALAIAEKFPGTIGFDIDAARVASLRDGDDRNGEEPSERLKASLIRWTDNPVDMAGATAFIVCAPTPIDDDKRPDLEPLRGASEAVGRVLKAGGLVVYESTVYPGVTEDFCGPVLARASGLRQGTDFALGYSPERINPGDRQHTLERIVKVVSGDGAESARRVAAIYGRIVPAGIHVAPSIRVAETAKVLENTQRDLNIALMNELAIICGLVDIRTKDVLDAARTKWNFLPFSPGLVGGHCIGVDPYYLTTMAERMGYKPNVILAGRRINDGMGAYVAKQTLRLLEAAGTRPAAARVAVFGLTFKENVRDTRNSRVPDIVAGLKAGGVTALAYDPLAHAAVVKDEYGLDLAGDHDLHGLDALILAVPHSEFLDGIGGLLARLAPGGVFVDVKSAVAPHTMPPGIRYWSL